MRTKSLKYISSKKIRLMDFRKIFGGEKPENHNLEEISKIKQEFEKEDKMFEKELPPKYDLLQEFQMNELKDLCIEILGQEPPVEYYNDPKSGKKELSLVKEDYVHFLVDELRLSEIINYALKKKVVSKDIIKKFKLDY
ncbi:MAG: hypothetical protein ACREA3_07970 [Nitrosotalea sp.]